MKFESLTVLEIIKETADSYTIRFKAPNNEWLNYLPGQYLTLKVNVNGEFLRRAYSLSSCPVTDQHLSVTVKAIEGGRVSNFLKNNLQKGDTIDALPAMGNFVVHIDPNHRHHYLLIGAGSGITPLMSILKAVLQEEKESHVTLIYGNSNESCIVFYDELEKLAEKYPERFDLIHVLSQPSAEWAGYQGRIAGDFAVSLLKDILNNNHLPFSVYICGPQGMMDAAESALEKLAVPAAQIHREYYSAPVADENEEEISYDIITRDVVVILDGVRRNVTVDADSNILQAVIDLDLDPPYACQEGICSTCRAKVHSGLVQMYIREGLSDEEIEAGYVLTCQCNPLTDDVVVEFA